MAYSVTREGMPVKMGGIVLLGRPDKFNYTIQGSKNILDDLNDIPLTGHQISGSKTTLDVLNDILASDVPFRRAAYVDFTQSSPTQDQYYTVLNTSDLIRIEYVGGMCAAGGNIQARITIDGTPIESANFNYGAGVWGYVYSDPLTETYSTSTTRTPFGADPYMDSPDFKYELRHRSSGIGSIQGRVRYGELA